MPIHMTVVINNFSIDFWPLIMGSFAILLFILWRRKHSFSNLLCFAVFGVYLIFALDKIFFPLQLSGSYVDFMREQPFAFTNYINLLPFYSGSFGTIADALPGLVQNVILTIPFGFGVNFIAQIRAKNFLWLAPAISLGIEIVQFAISLILQFPYRFADINDVMMNTLGIWIGYGIFRVFAWFYQWNIQRLGIEPNGLSAYIYSITSRIHKTRKS